MFISSVVLGELYYGARKSSRVTENLQKIDELAARSAVLVCDGTTAKWYGEIKNSLRTKGRPSRKTTSGSQLSPSSMTSHCLPATLTLRRSRI